MVKEVYCHGILIPDENAQVKEVGGGELKLQDSAYLAGLVQKAEDSISAMGDPRIKMFTGDRSHDPVNHPSHYTQGPMQVIDIIEQYGFCDDFRLGNCVKYLFRHKLKGTALEDLKKARWYLDRKIASMEQEKP